MSWHRLAVAASAAALAGLPACSYIQPTPPMANMSAAQRASVARVHLFGAGDAGAAHLTPIGSVKGYACNTNAADSGATLREAIEQTKYRAFVSGADAIANFSCAAVGAGPGSAQSWLCEQCNGTAALRSKS
jgi:hypothetical protein